MSIPKRTVYFLLTGVFSLSLLFSTGCSRHPNEEQINAMEEARSACLAAEQKLNDKTNENASLEQTLASKKAELDKLQKEKEAVQKRLSNWSTQE